MPYTDYFPAMTPQNNRKTSEPTNTYNCIAWAAGDNTRWWEPNFPFDLGYYWPANATESMESSSLVSAFKTLGYTKCQAANLEIGFDKVALYSKDGIWTHASRQKENGAWTSKLGTIEDIEHETPETVCCDVYGSIFCFMKRKKVNL